MTMRWRVRPLSSFTNSPRQRRIRERRWGPWEYDPKLLVLRYKAYPQDYYEVDLEECRTSAETLDWICQITEKTWATPEVVGWLVRALNDLLRPQAHLCSMGVERGPYKFTGAPEE